MELGRCIVIEIKPERLAHYREKLAALDVSDDRKDEVIRTLAWFMQSWVDKAFGVDPVQLAVRDKLNDSFHSAAFDGRIRDGCEAERIDLECEGAITPKQNERDVRHDASTKHSNKDHEGSHLLPRI